MEISFSEVIVFSYHIMLPQFHLMMQIKSCPYWLSMYFKHGAPLNIDRLPYSVTKAFLPATLILLLIATVFW